MTLTTEDMSKSELLSELKQLGYDYKNGLITWKKFLTDRNEIYSALRKKYYY